MQDKTEGSPPSNQMTAAELAAFQLFKEVHILNQLASAEFNRVLPDGLHVSHFSVLDHLHGCAEPDTPQALAHSFQTTKQNMSQALAQLQKRGLVEIAGHPTDGRRKIVTITSAGSALREAAIAALGETLREIIADPAYAAIARHLTELQKLRAFMEARRR